MSEPARISDELYPVFLEAMRIAKQDPMLVNGLAMGMMATNYGILRQLERIEELLREGRHGLSGETGPS